ncbi:hypothetical protein PFICI_04429 [Pestalotiopsis fici W106-1]|uniref:Heme haloperoxidase family profile domain-containing protein n=1 Tax=Pestalotiopsis fici (strain W106-1 / CGMCC3.15140) TaxID=1229662 RepID=W3X8V3_PESFW|nr:uncharacterized protein PFICI_04429 [Pestalotiopsis fici W106-1]ETS82553.1 hypothetical protein PFICI_04429 [Pestalotiopsis fici W106-1]
MKTTHILSLALFSALGKASYPASEPKGHHFVAPKADDSRSPCPGLNALANHGFLPRSGKNIDLIMVQTAAAEAHNFRTDVLTTAFQQAVDFKLSTTGNYSTINLEDLKKHDTIEIDGSLSRNDFYFGDDLHFDPLIWATVAKSLSLYNLSGEGGLYITVEMAARARAARVADAIKANPTFNASENEQQGSPGTTALWLTTLWDHSLNKTHKDWTSSWFEFERIPYLLGYKKPSVQTTPMFLGAMVQAIKSVPV